MAPRKTDPKPAVEPETIAERLEEICAKCWPGGWPHLSHSASCEHGEFSRGPAPAPAAGDEKTAETKTPAADTKTEDAPPAGDKTGA